jgi:hypothetical protein
MEADHGWLAATSSQEIRRMGGNKADHRYLAATSSQEEKREETKAFS